MQPSSAPPQSLDLLGELLWFPGPLVCELRLLILAWPTSRDWREPPEMVRASYVRRDTKVGSHPAPSAVNPLRLGQHLRGRQPLAHAASGPI